MSARGPRVSAWGWLRGGVGAIYVFIFAPILITAAVSFNGTSRSRFPPQGFSLRWWGEALGPRWMEPLAFSLELAALTAVVSLVVGVPLAFALVRYRFPGRGALQALTVGPLILPTLVTGIALLQFLSALGVDWFAGFWALLIGHVVICLPFSVRTVGIALEAMPARVEDAAANLGAPPWAVLRDVTFPLIKSGVFAGGVFSFIHSFSDVNLSIFLARPGERPITVTILSFLEYGFAPTLAAISMLTLAIPLALIWAIDRWVGVGDFVYGERARG